MSGIRQLMELMYGAFFNLFLFFASKKHFKIFCDASLANRLGVLGLRWLYMPKGISMQQHA
jgi:hypothetical protein